MIINWLVLSFFVIYSGLFKGGFHAAIDFPFSSPEIIQSFVTLPHIWTSLSGPFGGNQVGTLWSWPFGVILGIFSLIGFTHNLIIILCVVLILFLGSIGIFKIGQLLGLSKEAKIAAAFLYLANTYLLLLIDGGQILWALAYAYLPISLYQFEKNLKKRTFLTISDALIVSLLTFFDLRAFYLLALLLGIRFFLIFFVFEKKLFIWWVKFWLCAGGLIGVILLGLHAYWVVPLYFSRDSALPAALVNNLNGDFLGFTTIKHAILLQQPHWYQNIYGVISRPHKEFLLIPLLVLVGAWAKRRNWLAMYLLSVSTIGVFLAKGSQPPLPQIFGYLFNKIPGFFIFRDPTKFFVFIALGYSLLAASAIDFFKIKFSSKWNLAPLALWLLYLVILASPVFLGWTNGLFAPSPLYSAYQVFNQTASQLPEGKFLWIPSKDPAGFMDQNHLAINGVDLTTLRPFADGIKGDYETLNFLREASYSGQLLDIAGVGYLAYSPLNPKLTYKPDQIAYHQLFLKQLKERDWIDQAINLEIPVLKTKQHQQLFFIPQNIFLVVGSDKIYEQSTKSAQVSLSSNGFVFLDERAGTLAKIPTSLHHFFLNQTSDVDLITSFLHPKQFVFPAHMLNHSPNETGWWKRDGGEFLSFKNFLSEKYGILFQDFDLGGGWAIGEGAKALTVPISGKKGDQIFVRALQSTRSAELKIESANQQLSTVNLHGSGDNLLWFVAGTLSQDVTSLRILVNGDITVLNALTIVNKDQLQSLKDQEDTYVKEGHVFGVYEGSDEANPTVQFSKLTDDQYKVVTSGVKKPSALVFAQSYDPKWQLNGQSAFPIYSLFNGFMVDHDGEYLVEYSPHKYLKYGFMISLTTLLGLGGLLIWKKFKKT